MKRFSRTLVASALLTLAAAPALAATDTPPAAAAASQAQAGEPYLGVSIAPVPRALRAQLGDQLPAEQGLLVRQVMPGSPADEAGIQPFDILLAFGDQKLFAPQQLIQLVRASGTGSKVTLQVIHGGNATPMEVTVGARQPAQTAQVPMHRVRPQPRRPDFSPQPQPSPRTMQPLPRDARSWESFDAISLVKKPDGSYQATIEYLTRQGEKKRMEFEGSRAEIRDQILRQDDLPEVERNQLLGVLTGRDDLFLPALPIPRGFYMPRMYDWNPGF